MRRYRLVGAGLCILSISFVAAAQGGRQGRGTQGAQPGAQQSGGSGNTAGRGGRGGEAAAAPTGTLDFYNFDPTASAGQVFTDASPAETHQKITVNGQVLAYTTRAGYMPLHNATTAQSEAHLFYTAYAKEGVSDPATRPLLVFLGGAPGVSAAWQDLGGLGPKRVKWGTEGAGSYGWVDNTSTLLLQADLVFVNPVGTGFSRPDRPERGPAFWNTATDTASLGEFVRSFMNRYDRQMSPLFLAGEDFNTGRAAGLAGYLIEHSIPVQGVALLSVTTSADAQAGDAQYITLLPSLIMAAWHHKKLAPELNRMSSEQIAGQARQFASREYLHALYKGDRMSADERGKVLADLSRLTGLSKQFLVSNDLRISLDRFNSELLHDQQRGMSNSDSRATGYLPPPSGGGRGGRGFVVAPPTPIDFNLSNLSGGFLTSYEDYLHRELTFNGNSNGIFYLMNGGVSGYASTGNDDASLATAFARKPNLRLFVALNYFDLNSPFYAAEFTLAHLNVSPEVRARNITVSHLEAGQMPYLDSKALGKLHSDLAGFLSAGASQAAQ
jgi:carboxypeptidase C (cathepsin A)